MIQLKSTEQMQELAVVLEERASEADECDVAQLSNGTIIVTTFHPGEPDRQDRPFGRVKTQTSIDRFGERHDP